LTGRSTMV